MNSCLVSCDCRSLISRNTTLFLKKTVHKISKIVRDALFKVPETSEEQRCMLILFISLISYRQYSITISKYSTYDLFILCCSLARRMSKGHCFWLRVTHDVSSMCHPLQLILQSTKNCIIFFSARVCIQASTL